MPESIFTTQIPDSVGTETGGGTCQGTIFTTAVPGYVTGIRWYGPSPVPTVAPIGLLYRWDTDTTGAELARATFGTITASDWNTVLFASPVAIVPGQRYVAATWSKDQYVFKAHIHDTDIVSGNLTAPSTGTSGNAKFHNATATPVYPDGLTGGNNFGLFGDVLFTAALIPQGSRRRIVAPRASRTRTTVPVRAQVNPPLPIAAADQPRRLRGLLPRRTRVAQPAPAQVVVAPPAYVPQPTRARLKIFGVRRRAASTVPPGQALVPQPVKSKPRVLRIPRGRQAQLVPPPQVVAAPPFVPGPVRRPLARFALPRRGRSTTVLPATVAPQPPSWVPSPLHRALRALFARRRPASPVPLAQTAAPAPPRRPRSPLLARSRRGPLPRVPAPVPPPPNPAFIATTARRRPPVALQRRGRTYGGWWPAVCDCTTHRPTAGITARPNTGTTLYPTAVTARPNSGTTARPNTGITGRPCSC